ncbi:MAG: hypothetical protein ABI970_13065 [Chloroflexota bacterium]|nr:PD40 domain-containing protein [Anaerolineae bacterium]
MTGRTRTGLSVAYQVDGQPCTLQIIDTNRPTRSYTLLSKPPFCLPYSDWSPDHHYAAMAAYQSGLLSVGVGRKGSDWDQVFAIPDVVAARVLVAWSQDSRQLAFINWSAEVTLIGTIRMENNIPGQVQLFTITGTQPIAYSSLAWSPDGHFIAFAAYDAPRRQGGQELYTLNLMDGSVRRLTTDTNVDESPSWSPDGSALVFTSAVAGYNELFIMDVASGERRRLTYYTNGYLPNWSPDGKSIVFESNLDYNYDLYIIGANGFGLRRLTYHHSPLELFPIWLR